MKVGNQNIDKEVTLQYSLISELLLEILI